MATLLALPIGLLSACGDDGEPETIAIDAEIEITPQPDSAADQDDPAQPDTTTDSALTPASERVRLGNRFEWCSPIQNMWDELDEAAVALAAVDAEAEDAQRALDRATDELDRAEAADVLYTAWDKLDAAYSDHSHIVQQAVDQLHRARETTGSGTEEVALSRAWEALAAADPALLAASDAELVAVPPAALPAPEQPPEPVFESDEEREAALAKEAEQRAEREELEREWEREQEEYERVQTTLSILMWETAAGSPAYTAFKESFRESCA